MLRKVSLILVAFLSITLTSAIQAFAENWFATERISNKREVKIQIDKDSIRSAEQSWFSFMQRLQTDSNPPAEPFKGEVNCIRKIFSSIYSNDERQDQIRRNGKWFIDFVHKDDPSDTISVEVEPGDDAYREKTFAWICSNYKK